jgi:hypothetical protein
LPPPNLMAVRSSGGDASRWAGIYEAGRFWGTNVMIGKALIG